MVTKVTEIDFCIERPLHLQKAWTMNIEQIIESGKVILVDVRSVEEFEEQTLPGAINIPLHTIPVRLNEFKAMKSPIVVFCRSGARSYQASTWLKQNGVEVHDGGSISNLMQVMSKRIDHQ